MVRRKKAKKRGRDSSGSTEQDHRVLLRSVKSLKEELKDLQIRYERMNGEALEGLSVSELESILNRLCQALLSVRERLAEKTKEQEEAERVFIEEEEEDQVKAREVVEQKRSENIWFQFTLSNKRRIARHNARELRSRLPTLEDKQLEQDHQALLRRAESIKTEIKSLQLLIERMDGKELAPLNFYQLAILQREIQYGRLLVNAKRVIAKRESARSSKEVKGGTEGQD